MNEYLQIMIAVVVVAHIILASHAIVRISLSEYAAYRARKNTSEKLCGLVAQGISEMQETLKTFQQNQVDNNPNIN